jgi:hypothetical protein
MYGWQPIETAPRDGTVILGRIILPDGETTEALRWDAQSEEWIRANAVSPLALFPQQWMPAAAL